MRKLLLLLNFFVIFNSYGQSLVSKFDVAPNGANSVTFVDKSIGALYLISGNFREGYQLYPKRKTLRYLIPHQGNIV